MAAGRGDDLRILQVNLRQFEGGFGANRVGLQRIAIDDGRFGSWRDISAPLSPIQYPLAHRRPPGAGGNHARGSTASHRRSVPAPLLNRHGFPDSARGRLQRSFVCSDRRLGAFALLQVVAQRRLLHRQGSLGLVHPLLIDTIVYLEQYLARLNDGEILDVDGAVMATVDLWADKGGLPART